MSWQEADDAFNRSMDEAQPEEAVDTPIGLEQHVILALGYADHGYCYAEGHSGPLWAGLIPPEEKGYSWFCFEEPWVSTAMELQRLGFTAGQILEARKSG